MHTPAAKHSGVAVGDVVGSPVAVRVLVAVGVTVPVLVGWSVRVGVAVAVGITGVAVFAAHWPVLVTQLASECGMHCAPQIPSTAGPHAGPAHSQQIGGVWVGVETAVWVSVALALGVAVAVGNGVLTGVAVCATQAPDSVQLASATRLHPEAQGEAPVGAGPQALSH